MTIINHLYPIIAICCIQFCDNRTSKLFCLALLIVLMVSIGLVADHKHYSAAFSVGIYPGPFLWEWLQIVAKTIFSSLAPSDQYLFFRIGIVFIISLLFESRYFSHIIFSQFGFLFIFNALRQGLATISILVILSKFYKNFWLCLALLIIFPALFHSSALFIAAVFALSYYRIGNRCVNVMALLIFGVVLALMLDWSLSFLGSKYVAYLRPSGIDFTETTLSRTDPHIKFLVFLIYSILTVGWRYMDQSTLIGVVARLKFLLSVLACSAYFLLDYSELGTRVFLYFLGVDALFHALNRDSSKFTSVSRVSFLMSSAFSPNVHTIIKQGI